MDNTIVAAYPTHPRREVGLTGDILPVLKKAMLGVLGPGGTAAQARVPGVQVAGKTGTAQWGGNGDRSKQRTAAWFVGFAPVEKPQYAFAALYEGEPGDNSVHGGTNAAPLMGKVLREIYKKEKPDKTNRHKKKHDDDDDDNDNPPPADENSKDESD